MARPPRQPPVPSAFVPALVRYIASRGREVDTLLERFALPANVAERDEVDVVPQTIDDLLEAAADLLAEPYLALRLPAELPLRRYTFGELAARAAGTLRESLIRLAPHVHPRLACTLVDAEWHQVAPGHPRGIGRTAHEYGLAYVVTHMRAVLAEPPALVRVWFAHARPRELAPLDRLFGTEELEFGAADSGFELAASALDRPLVTADPRLAATVAELAPSAPPRDDLAARVAGSIRARLPEPTSADDAAALLHMSARTLQRRLEALGTTFSGVVDATREALARELLADPAIPLAEVGYRVGFADLATFSRAFKRWTGTSPGRFRRC